MGRRRPAIPDAYATLYRRYAAALRAAAGLSEHTRRAYDARVRAFLTWAADTGLPPDRLDDHTTRDHAVRAYIHALRTGGRTPRTADAHLTAVDHLFTQLRLDPPNIARSRPAPGPATRVLEERQQRAYLHAVRRRPLARDRAIGHLLLHTGLRISELAALDVTDVTLRPRSGVLTVEAREVPLVNPPTRRALRAWLTDRAGWPGAHTPALFLNRRGGRLTTRAIAHLIDQLATTAGLTDANGRPTATARTLRHTANREHGTCRPHQ